MEVLGQEMIEDSRVSKVVNFLRIVVGVDPAVTSCPGYRPRNTTEMGTGDHCSLLQALGRPGPKRSVRAG
ncbi:MAG: hypothetical protein Q8J68_01895 [Methanolobus sp.]|uniref:hypothetical protein n=1 Tax=Methanolobus sp. TaxID=1874737 RepID=UPI0027317BA8|nr:hypothetical protein [Methanolobus sp.]MDP2216028.1 hypothetical protein [Methanolobus sp.]